MALDDVHKWFYWEAWYVGGKIYNSKDTRWADLPDDGVLSVKVYSDSRAPDGDRYAIVLDGGQWYFWLGDRPVNDDDNQKQIMERYPEARDFKRGQWSKTQQEWQTVKDDSWGKQWD